MSSSSDDAEFLIDSTQPEISEDQNANDKMLSLPEKSKEKYLAVYETFMLWKNNDNTFSEDIFIKYFNELAEKYKPTSLWPIYSMLKATVKSKIGIDLKKYTKLAHLLKKLCAGATTNKSPVLKAKDIEKFLKEAPDYVYLSAKVALIFAITGACGSKQLAQITTKDIEQHGEVLLVKITNTKNNIPRTFHIHGQYYEIVKKYEALRPKNAKSDRFFQGYHNGKCTAQPIGVNTFGSMPRNIAKFLGLPEPDSYNAHSFKRTSFALQGGGGRILFGDRVSDLTRNTSVASGPAQPEPRSSIPHEITLLPPPSNIKSTPEQDPFSSHENSMSPPFINVKTNPDSRPPSPSGYFDENVQTFSQTFKTPDNNVTYTFTNCRFHNCFSK